MGWEVEGKNEKEKDQEALLLDYKDNIQKVYKSRKKSQEVQCLI